MFEMTEEEFLECEQAERQKHSVAIAEYIDYYNNKRIQVKTKWMPPVKYREASIRSA